jgi:hypothetical protein
MGDVCNLEAVRAYVRTGTLTAVSREMDIPMAQLARWSKQPWWHDEVLLLRREQAAVLDSQLTRLHDQTILELIDRVENGEKVKLKNGREGRAAMKARDVAAVAHIIFTERQLLRNEPTTIAGETGKVTVLAEKLRTLGRHLGAPMDILDVEVRGAEEADASS